MIGELVLLFVKGKRNLAYELRLRSFCDDLLGAPLSTKLGPDQSFYLMKFIRNSLKTCLEETYIGTKEFKDSLRML